MVTHKRTCIEYPSGERMATHEHIPNIRRMDERWYSYGDIH